MTQKRLQDACNSGDTISCYNLGVSYANGQDGVEQDYQKANKLYYMACNNKIGDGCLGLGNLYNDGRGVKQDNKKANELYLL